MTTKTTTKMSKLSAREHKALVLAAADQIDDARSAHDLAVEFGIDQTEVEDLQAAIRQG